MKTIDGRRIHVATVFVNERRETYRLKRAGQDDPATSAAHDNTVSNVRLAARCIATHTRDGRTSEVGCVLADAQGNRATSVAIWERGTGEDGHRPSSRAAGSRGIP